MGSRCDTFSMLSSRTLSVQVGARTAGRTVTSRGSRKCLSPPGKTSQRLLCRGHPRCDAAQELVGCQAEPRLQPDTFPNLLAHLPGKVPGRAEQPAGAGNVQKEGAGLGRFHQGRVGCQKAEEEPCDPQVEFRVRGQKPQVRAGSQGLLPEHALVQAFTAGLGRDRLQEGSARTGRTDRHRPPPEGGVAQLLHRNRKRRHLEVKNLTFHIVIRDRPSAPLSREIASPSARNIHYCVTALAVLRCPSP